MNRLRLFPAWLKLLGAVLLFGYLLVALLQNHAAIAARRQELAGVQQQLETQRALNQELTRALDDDADAIIERIAREQGYARPNERVFIGY